MIPHDSLRREICMATIHCITHPAPSPTHHRSLQRLNSTADKTKNRNVFHGVLEEETQ